jgi:hypothetical protein
MEDEEGLMHQKTEEQLKYLMKFDLKEFSQQVRDYSWVVEKMKGVHPVNGGQAFVMGQICGALEGLQDFYKEHEL